MQSLEQLKSFEFIQEITPDSRKLLGQELQISTFSKGQEILRKGDCVSGAFLVAEGRLRIYTISEGGQEGTLNVLEPGSACIFALTCLFNDVFYPAWIESETTSRVAIVPGWVFRQLFKTEPAIHRFMFDSLASLVFDLTINLDRVMTNNLETRLAGFLLTRASNTGVVKMSHKQIAGQLGTAREVISRQLKSFREKEWVETQRGRIRVVDPDAITSFLDKRLTEHTVPLITYKPM